jgi:5-bromo-4-chloroindolyl phosphate hydrolysis protein
MGWRRSKGIEGDFDYCRVSNSFQSHPIHMEWDETNIPVTILYKNDTRNYLLKHVVIKLFQSNIATKYVSMHENKTQLSRLELINATLSILNYKTFQKNLEGQNILSLTKIIKKYKNL